MTQRAALILVAWVVVSAPLGAQETSRLTRVLDSGRPSADRRLQGAVNLDAYHPWTPPRDLAAWGRRAERVRRQILVAAGLWPMPPSTPLDPHVHGRIERAGYTVEKVFFTSYPGHYVTGNLYRPAGAGGRRPGILSPHGHWPNGRFFERSERDAGGEIAKGAEAGMAGARYPLQARCAQLARMGCVVFHYDMVGNADSRQIPHAGGFGDLEAELRLQSAFGLQTYNTLRAFDFLAGLADVDPERIGVTGASGGGTQTFILCALDPRPAAAFPAVMVSTAMQGGCVCENASHLRVGTGNVEFAALAAPRPYGMTGANDWTIDIATKGLPELKALWGAYGVEDRVAAWCLPAFDHNYNQVSRELMYDWFNRHLGLGLASPVVEEAFEPISPADLAVFDTAHLRPADAVDAQGLRRWLGEASDRQIASLAPHDPGSFAEFQRVIGGALEVLLHTHMPPDDEPAADGGIDVTRVAVQALPDGARLEKLLIGRHGCGEEVPAVLVVPARWSGAVLVSVHPGGKESALLAAGGALAGGTQEALRRGIACLAPDVFLTGELVGPQGSPAATQVPRDGRRHASYVGYTYGYNRTLLAQRVHDVLTAAAFARRLAGQKPVHLAGWGDAGAWVVLARALAGTAIGKTFAERLGDFDAALGFDDPRFLPGARKYGGMASFLGLCAPGDVALGAEEPAAAALAAYAARGAGGRLLRAPPEARGEPAMSAWLAAWLER